MGFKLGHKNYVTKEFWDKYKKDNPKKWKERSMKMSIAHKGKHNSLNTEFKKGQTSLRKGIKLSEETKLKLSNSMKKQYQEGKRINPTRGKEIPKERRERISKTLKERYKNKELIPLALGREVSKETKEKLRKWNLGKKYSEESKEKMSLARLGEKNPSWLGGKSFEPYSPEFNKKLKEQIRKRDNYRCQECFRHQDELRTSTNRKRKLTIHHIDYNKKNNNPNNLISLCLNCHLQTNYNRNDWIGYYQNKLNKNGGI